MSRFKKFFVGTALCILLTGAFTGYAYAEGTKVGVIKCEVINVREARSTSSELVGMIEKGTQVTVLQESGDWCKIKFNSVSGWVKGQYLTIKSTPTKNETAQAKTTAQTSVQSAAKSGTITGDVVNLRNSPDTTAKILDKLQQKDSVKVLNYSDGWYKVRTSGGVTGWVYKQYIAVKEASSSRGAGGELSRARTEAVKAAVVEEPKVSIAAVESKDSKESNDTAKDTSDLGQQIVEYSKKFLGVKYVWGGASPKGFDCSGLVKYVYNHFGINVNRVAADQAKQGEKVAKGELKPGDLVFFDTDGGMNYINHVGIYAGDGKFVEASSGRSRVIVMDMDNGFYSRVYMGAKRMLK